MPEPTPAHANASPTAARDSAQTRVQEEATEILRALANARELTVTGPVRVDLVDRAGIRAYAKANMYDETTPHELAMFGRMQQALGVLPPTAHMETVLLDMLEAGVAGFYDPKKKALFIGDFVSSMERGMVIGHEIAHGLQDMHFDLQALTKSIPYRSDAEEARRFLIEGEAQAAYLAWRSAGSGLAAIEPAILAAMRDQGLLGGGQLAGYAVLERMLYLPYTDGTATIVELVVQQGWPAVDALYRALPQSTEQMLHLDKLLSREAPVAIALDAARLERDLNRRAVWHDTLGEAALLALLAQAHGSSRARKAAAGWGGDHIVVFDGDEGGAPVAAWVVTWDSATDAKEFEAAFETVIAVVLQGRGAMSRRDKTTYILTHPPAEPASYRLLGDMARSTERGEAAEALRTRYDERFNRAAPTTPVAAPAEGA